jgi:hypothetical protein
VSRAEDCEREGGELAGFEEEDGHLSDVKVDEMAGFSSINIPIL